MQKGAARQAQATDPRGRKLQVGLVVAQLLVACTVTQAKGGVVGAGGASVSQADLTARATVASAGSANTTLSPLSSRKPPNAASEMRSGLAGETPKMAGAGAALNQAGFVGAAQQRPPAEATSAETTNAGTMMNRIEFSKPSDSDILQRLSPLEYEVTQHGATEPPFRNRYWDNHEAGIYVDVVTGEPLFSSKDKFESGTGWPSFAAPIEPNRVIEKPDRSLGMVRTEVRSAVGGSHLGHVFDDGPQPTGLRYCINSASLRFVPRSKLIAEGYGLYEGRFSVVGTPDMAPSTTNSCAVEQGKSGGCAATLDEAYLSGGCFWGMQDLLRKIPGVVETQVGYLGGAMAHPTYEDVKTGSTGHAETVRILFEPKRLSFSELLEKWFFRMHDPTTPNRQGNDRGSQYRSVIFYTSDAQRDTATQVIERVNQSGKWKAPIVTEVIAAKAFTPAEEYHQDYLVKHPGGYTCHYLRD